MNTVDHIPYIFHQTWKSNRIPRKLQQLRSSWRQYHPSAEHWLWSDDDNRAFLQKHYAWFLPVYDAYPEKIMRVDAVRYFILKHFGGIYVDLDFECLKPIDELLQDQQLLIGCEPPQHLREMQSLRQYSQEQILCNAFMASIPEHPFWEHGIRLLEERSKRADTLSATGPFFLTDAYYSYADKDTVNVLPSTMLYPVDKHTIKKPRRYWPLQQAYAVHHWHGSWWTEKNSIKAVARRIVIALLKFYQSFKLVLKQYLRRVYILLQPSKGEHYRLQWNLSSAASIEDRTCIRPNQIWCTRLIKGKCAARALADIHVGTEILVCNQYPMVSCLMVTREREVLGRRAVECFRRQNYPCKELVIVDDGSDKKLEEWVRSLEDDTLIYLRLPDEKKSLGELRNFSLQQAHGQYVAQWDDDDLSHPDRLSVQMSMMAAAGVEISFLQRQMIWRPERQQLAASQRRMIENTIVCRKTLMPSYPEQGKGEDTPVCEKLAKSQSIILCDQPDLYIYVAHQSNTWESRHFDKIWDSCSQQYCSDAYHRKLKALESEYSVSLFKSDYFDGVPLPLEHYVPFQENKAERYPTLLVLVPVKNAAVALPRLFENLESTWYPPSRISLAFLESDSNDGSHEVIAEHLSELRERYARVELYKHDFGYHSQRPRWSVDQQYRRRLILAYSRNMLLFRALRDEDWVMWIDADVKHWPHDAFIQLLDTGKDIVVPHCVRENGETFDLNTFKLAENAKDLNWRRYVVDGILQPPVGYGRQYLGDCYGQYLVELDAVGGTMLLVKADVHRRGLVFPAYSHRHYIETEGLAQMAIDMGFSCWGMPGLEIVHP